MVIAPFIMFLKFSKFKVETCFTSVFELKNSDYQDIKFVEWLNHKDFVMFWKFFG